MNLNVILSPWTIFFVALIVIIVMLIFLTLLERKLKKKVSIRMEERLIFQKKLNSLKSPGKNPHNLLLAIDALARDFFSQHYKIGRNEKYSEMSKEFKKSGNIGASQFCERMQETMYSGDEPTQEKLDFLVRNLEFLINEKNKISKTEKMENKIQSLKFLSPRKTPVLDKRIVEYLTEGMSRGFGLDLLREKLLGAGFTKEEISLAENHLNLYIKKEEPVVEEQPQAKIEESVPEIPIPEKNVTKIDLPMIKSLDNLERIKEKISDKNEIIGAKRITEKTGLI